MPLIKSAKKRVRTANKAAVRNSKTKRLLKNALKNFSKTPTSKSQNSAQSMIDRSVKKGIVHKNKAARLKRKMAAQAKNSGVKHSTTKKLTAKPAAKKTTTKKK